MQCPLFRLSDNTFDTDLWASSWRKMDFYLEDKIAVSQFDLHRLTTSRTHPKTTWRSCTPSCLGPPWLIIGITEHQYRPFDALLPARYCTKYGTHGYCDWEKAKTIYHVARSTAGVIKQEKIKQKIMLVRYEVRAPSERALTERKTYYTKRFVARRASSACLLGVHFHNIFLSPRQLFYAQGQSWWKFAHITFSTTMANSHETYLYYVHACAVRFDYSTRVSL